jgi:hypothetical protein
MDGLKLKEDIYKIKDRLDKVEEDLRLQIAELTIKERKWNNLDEIAENKKKNENVNVKFNICGKKFQTKVATLLNTKDTLFYKIIISNEVDLNEELFFDRSPKFFGYILDFLRTKKINLKRFNKNEKEDLKREAQYFEIGELLTLIGEGPSEPEFISHEINAVYLYSGTIVGTNKVEDLSDPTMMKGICANTPGSILIELNSEWNINGIEIGGYRGNASAWSCDNGAYASIKVSTDKSIWTQVGTIPTGFGTSIKTVSFSFCQARYLKFEYTSYLGIGYLKVKTC